MEGSESTVNGRVSMPWAARVVREEALRAVAKTRRLWEWNVRAREWPIPPGEQLGRMLARRWRELNAAARRQTLVGRSKNYVHQLAQHKVESRNEGYWLKCACFLGSGCITL